MARANRKSGNKIFLIHSVAQWQWTFRHITDLDGKSLIIKEIDSLGDRSVRVKAALDTMLRYLQSERNLRRPYAAALHGDCEGLLEILLTVDRVQHRPLGYYGPRQRDITMLLMAEEHGGVFVPLDACGIALRRKGKIDGGEAGVVDHKF